MHSPTDLICSRPVLRNVLCLSNSGQTIPVRLGFYWKVSPPFRLWVARNGQVAEKLTGRCGCATVALAVVALDNGTIVTSQVAAGTVVSLGIPNIMDSQHPSTHMHYVEEREIEYESMDLPREGIAAKEKLRRQNIAKSNKGRVPWNKGKRHSPETIERIREKTRQAMLNPKVREKLRNCGKNPSEETKDKIRNSMRMTWQMKRMMKLCQEMCLREWKDIVAEAARQGGLGDEEFDWDTYNMLKQRLLKERIAATKQLALKKKEDRAVALKAKGVSDEHRQKISDAIRAKWADPEYRNKVSKGMQKERPAVARKAAVSSNQITGLDEEFIAEVLADENAAKARKARMEAAGVKGHASVTLPRPAGSQTAQPVTSSLAVPKKNNVHEKDWLKERDSSSTRLSYEGARPIKESPLRAAYVDLLASDKLEKIKRLREGWLMMELRRKEAAKRARMLMAEAEKAADALEAAAGTDKVAMASLLETRRLLAEAARSMQSAELGRVGDSFSNGTWEPGNGVSKRVVHDQSGFG